MSYDPHTLWSRQVDGEQGLEGAAYIQRSASGFSPQCTRHKNQNAGCNDKILYRITCHLPYISRFSWPMLHAARDRRTGRVNDVGWALQSQGVGDTTRRDGEGHTYRSALEDQHMGFGGLEGEIYTRNHRLSHDIWSFPAKFPLNQSIVGFAPAQRMDHLDPNACEEF